MESPRVPGGTSIPEKRSFAPWITFFVTAAAGAWLVHQVSSGNECGWNWGAVGGACRVIIFLSIVSGVFAGVCAAGAVRERARDQGRRALVLVGLAIAALVGGTWCAKQMEDYREESRARFGPGAR